MIIKSLSGLSLSSAPDARAPRPLGPATLGYMNVSHGLRYSAGCSKHELTSGS